MRCKYDSSKGPLLAASGRSLATCIVFFERCWICFVHETLLAGTIRLANIPRAQFLVKHNFHVLSAIHLFQDRLEFVMSAGGPSLIHSPSGSSSTESHVEFDPNVDLTDVCTDFSSVFPGEFEQEDVEDLQKLGWVRRTEAERSAWLPSWVPYWTRPDWDPSIEVSFDGTNQRAVRGDAENTMRPTILPGDNDVPRTFYTKYVCYLFSGIL